MKHVPGTEQYCIKFPNGMTWGKMFLSGHLYNTVLDGVIYCLWFCFSCVLAWRLRSLQYILLTQCHEEVLYAASDPTLTFVCPGGPGAFWYDVLLMITYNYFCGTARTQDHVYIVYRCNVTNSKNWVVSQASRVFCVCFFPPTTGGCS